MTPVQLVNEIRQEAQQGFTHILNRLDRLAIPASPADYEQERQRVQAACGASLSDACAEGLHISGQRADG